MKLKHIGVYCGSNFGHQTIYKAAAERLAESLVERGIGLVYGGATVGLMGAIADRVLEAGGEAIGVIPEALFAKEIAHQGLTELIVVRSMHERKMIIAERSDAFVALPGGIGTLEELFEIWTWGQLGFHAKPCGVLNVGGYYDGLIEFLDHAVEQEFVKGEHRSMLAVETEPRRLVEHFASYQPPKETKWVGGASN